MSLVGWRSYVIMRIQTLSSCWLETRAIWDIWGLSLPRKQRLLLVSLKRDEISLFGAFPSKLICLRKAKDTKLNLVCSYNLWVFWLNSFVLPFVLPQLFLNLAENNLSFIETSALDASNVEQAFQNILTGEFFHSLLDPHLTILECMRLDLFQVALLLTSKQLMFIFPFLSSCIVFNPYQSYQTIESIPWPLPQLLQKSTASSLTKLCNPQTMSSSLQVERPSLFNLVLMMVVKRRKVVVVKEGLRSFFFLMERSWEAEKFKFE